MTTRTVNTAQRDLLSALPVGSVVRVEPDGDRPAHHVVRIEEEGMAATGGWSLAGGRHWLQVAEWSTVLTVVSVPVPDRDTLIESIRAARWPDGDRLDDLTKAVTATEIADQILADLTGNGKE